MSVNIEKSICVDCKGRLSCARLKRLNPGTTIRDSMKELYNGVDTGVKSGALLYIREARKKEIFEMIITVCSLKEQYAFRLKMRDIEEINTLYYCKMCQTMHRSHSSIGISHEKYSGEK